MTSHILELSNRYLLGVGDNQTYTICRLQRAPEGGWLRSNGKICRNFDQVLDCLIHQELSQEDKLTLADCAKTLHAIRAELKEAIAIEQSY